MEDQATPEELYAAMMEERARCVALIREAAATAKALGADDVAERLLRAAEKCEHPTEEV